MESFLDNPLTEVGGYATASGSIILQVATALDLAKINPIITAATGIAGFIFLVYKINHTRISSKNNKLTTKLLERQLREQDANGEYKESNGDHPAD